MKIKQKLPQISIIAICSTLLLTSCSKESTQGPGTDPCAGKTIVVTATAGSASNCGSTNGSIVVSASGSTGFTYKVGSGSYQASGTFANIGAGTQTVFAKDADGCEESEVVTIQPAVAGPLFTAVKTLLASSCVSCHNSTLQNGGRNWSADCNIVEGKDRIKIRAVDEGTMPQGGSLTAAQKTTISNWINAGGKFTD